MFDGAGSACGSGTLERNAVEGKILDSELAGGMSACGAVAKVDGNRELVDVDSDGERVELAVATSLDVREFVGHRLVLNIIELLIDSHRHVTSRIPLVTLFRPLHSLIKPPSR